MSHVMFRCMGSYLRGCMYTDNVIVWRMWILVTLCEHVHGYINTM